MISAFPIVDRELRVRSRWPITYWIRVIAAGVAMLLSIGGLLMYQSQLRGQLGQIIFQLLSVVTLLFCLFEGLRNTSDCISEETREGTIGLLFLTPLRGVDVVFGKLVAASLNSVYGLAAILSILAIPLLAGGVTFVEFARSCLVFLNALFLALTVGLWVSARSRNQRKSILASLAILMFVVGGLPLIDFFVLGQTSWPQEGLFAIFSPGWGLYLSDDILYQANPLRFWVFVGAVQLLGWTLIVWSSFQIVNAYRADSEEAAKSGFQKPEQRNSRRFHNNEQLETNPYLWLCRYAAHSKRWIWIATIAMAILPMGTGWLFRLGPAQSTAIFSFVLGAICNLGFLIVILLLTSHTVAEAKQSGLLEILLTTPLCVRDYMSGHWQYVKWLLLAPILLIVGCRLLPWMGYLMQTISIGMTQYFAVHLSQFMHLLNFLTGILALVWAGFWFSLSSNNQLNAIGKTIVLTQCVPWLANFFVPAFIRAFQMSLISRGFNLWFVLLVSIPPLAIDILIVLWARKQIRRHFRTAATGDFKSKFKCPWSFCRSRPVKI